MRRLLVAAALAAAFVALPALADGRVGANLNFIADFFRNHEFNDLVKQSRLFLKIGQFDDSQAANRATIHSSDGWPSEDFRLFVMTDQAGVGGLGGTYKLVFTGQATLAASGATIQNKTYAASTNTTRADVVFPAGGDTLYIDFSGTGGMVKNVRLLRPGVPEVNPPKFNPAWTAHVGRFGVVRYLDWTRTNGNRHVNWADRTTPEKLRTETVIAQWETVIDAANALGRDAWINVPVQASDEYVTNLATLFRDRLNPGLNLYVEYGNELWNFSIRDVGLDEINGGTPFNGATVNRDLAAASPQNSPLRFEAADDTTLGFRRVALRLKEISDIFRTVWGTAAINTRVRPVLAGQMSNSFIVNEGLRLVDEGLGIKPDTVFYAIAGAPYIFAAAEPDAEADETPGLTVTQILDGMAAGVANAPSESNAYQYLSHAGLGAWYGLKVLAYEAGFDNFGPNNIDNKRLANLDARVKGICKDYINQWHAFGFDTLLWFNAGAATYNTEFGMWPLVEDLSNPAVPKNQCIDEVLAAAAPAVTVGTPAVGAPIAGGNYRDSTNPTGPATGFDSPFGFPGYVEYLLRSSTEGTFNLVFTGNADPGETFRVKLNNATVAASVALPETSGNSGTLTVRLRQGLNALRIERATGASWTIASFTFTVCPAGDTDNDGVPNCVEGFEGLNAGVRDNDIFANARLFAMQQYRDFLNREGDSGGITFWTNQIQTGAQSRAQCVESFFNSAEFQNTVAPVVRLYFAYFLRIPDYDGLQFWINYYKSGNSLDSVSNHFAASPEFQNTYGPLDNTQYVTLVYNNVLGRAPESEGLNFWVNQLNTGQRTRGQVMLAFSESAEYRALSFVDVYVTMMYVGMLRRSPDNGGFDFWTGYMDAGNSGLALIGGFLASPEYHNRFLP